MGVFVLLFCVFWRVYGFPLGTPFFVSNLKRKESKSNDTRRTNNSKPPPNDEYSANCRHRIAPRAYPQADGKAEDAPLLLCR